MSLGKLHSICSYYATLGTERGSTDVESKANTNKKRKDACIPWYQSPFPMPKIYLTEMG